MIRCWIAEAGAVRAAPPAEAVRVATEDRGAIWVDFQGEPEATVRETLAPLGVHPLVLDDMVAEVNRPKVDSYGPYIYVVVHSARWDGDRPVLREVDMVLGRRFLVTHTDEPTRSIETAQQVLPRRPELLTRSPAELLHFLLDVLVDHYLPIMDRITEEIDALEESVFEEQDLAVHGRIVRLKRGMSALRRVVGPQRDTVLALTRDEYAPVPAETRPYLRDVYDRLARVTDLLDSFRDEAATLLDLHVSIASNRLNEVIKRLTVIATIGLPLTVVTSYYGMNFPLPEYHFAHAEIYIWAVMALTAALTWIYLKWKKWL